MKKKGVALLEEKVDRTADVGLYFASWCWGEMIELSAEDRRKLRKAMDFDTIAYKSPSRVVAVVSLIGSTKKVRKAAFRLLAGKKSRGMAPKKDGGRSFARAARAAQAKVLKKAIKKDGADIDNYYVGIDAEYDGIQDIKV